MLLQCYQQRNMQIKSIVTACIKAFLTLMLSWLLNNFAFSHFHFLKSVDFNDILLTCYILKLLFSDKFACGIYTYNIIVLM